MSTTEQEDDEIQQQGNKSKNNLETPVGSPDGIPLAGDGLEADKDTLPLYLVQTVGRACETINMAKVLEDMNEEGFGDFNNKADGMLDHDDAMVEALEKQRQQAGVEEDETVEFNDCNAILLQKGATGPELKLPGPPTNWLAPTRKVAKGEPLFIEVNNPGGWDEYTYRPKFATKGEKKYVRHVLPAGASPVPEVDRKRMVGPWEFFYGG
jgi:hypothetical protein